MIWKTLKRTLAVIVILIATIGFAANAVGLVGIWVIRRPAHDAITKLSAFVDQKLGTIDQALARVSARSEDGRQAVARVNDAAAKLSDRLEENRPLLAGLSDAARDDLAPKIEKIRAQAVALHEGAVSVNAALETLDGLGFINIPTFTDELSAVSERVDAARDDVQDLRAALDAARAAAPANLIAAVTARTAKIDNVMTQIKSVAVDYQAKVAQRRQQTTSLKHRLLRAIKLLVLSLTAVFIVVAAGQVLLIYLCWQYVRRGSFPSLRPAKQPG